MVDHIIEILAEFADFDNNKRAATSTPAGENLFVIRADAKPLPEAQAQAFHHFVAKALYLSKRARPDILLTVAFLTTRVSMPDVDDWRKLLRMVRHL